MSARSSVHSFQGSSHPYRGWVTVAVIHILIGYALISGMAQKGLHLIKKPLEAVVIQEVVIPPPPPPPKIDTPFTKISGFVPVNEMIGVVPLFVNVSVIFACKVDTTTVALL